MKRIASPARILLTGASGRLGGALARLHARPGVHLTLWGRDTARLEACAAACRNAGATVQVRVIDLADGEAAIAALHEDDEKVRFEMAYLVAGLGDTCAPGEIIEAPEQVLRLARVNFAAPAAMASALGRAMVQRSDAARPGGRIVLIGSAAGQHALPSAASYAASKAGLARFAEALRIALAPHGVSVTLAAPGFIDTPQGRSVPGGKAMLLDVEEAARRIARAGLSRKGYYVTPWPFAALRVIDRALPRALRDRLLRAGRA